MAVPSSAESRLNMMEASAFWGASTFAPMIATELDWIGRDDLLHAERRAEAPVPVAARRPVRSVALRTIGIEVSASTVLRKCGSLVEAWHLWEGRRHQGRLEQAAPLQRAHHVRGKPAARVVKRAIELRGLQPEDVVCAGVVTAPALATAWIVPGFDCPPFRGRPWDLAGPRRCCQDASDRSRRSRRPCRGPESASPTDG